MSVGNVPPVPTTVTPSPSPMLGPPALVGIAVVLVLLGALGYWYVFKPAPAPAKMYTIGIPHFPQQNDAVLGFKQGMEKLGYKEGVNVQYDMEKVFVNPKMFDELTVAVNRMIDSRVDMIFASLEHVAKIALEVSKQKGSTIPIVFLTRFNDPVEYGLIQSYTSSGNNSTGIAANLVQTVQRSLGFFKEINPDLKKLGIFTDGFMAPGISDAYLAQLKKEAPNFGITIVEYTTTKPPPDAESEFHRVANAIKPGEIDGLFHLAGHYIGPQEALESDLATRLRIPMAAPFEDLPNGGMFSYSDEFQLSGEQSAVLADKIFKGTKPADIPIEFGARSVLTLMLGRARDAGVTFTDSMLFIATNKFENASDFPPIFKER